MYPETAHEKDVNANVGQSMFGEVTSPMFAC